MMIAGTDVVNNDINAKLKGEYNDSIER